MGLGEGLSDLDEGIEEEIEECSTKFWSASGTIDTLSGVAFSRHGHLGDIDLGVGYLIWMHHIQSII